MYDLIIAPANGFTHDWQLPSKLIKRLELVAKLYREDVAPKVAVVGKWSIVFDTHNLPLPPITEAELMKQALIRFGVPVHDIFKEETSQDTIGNAYFIKKTVVIPHHYRKLLVVCEDFHLKRCKFLFEKIIPECEIGFMTAKTNSGNNETFKRLEEEIYRSQEEFLLPMNPGDDNFLAKRLYGDPFYTRRRPMDQVSRISMGSFK